MIRALTLSLFVLVVSFCKAQIHVDSARIVQLDDTLQGVALYGVVMPSGPCTIIDTSKQITHDTASISLCYLYGNAASVLCRGYDTIVLGNIGSAYHTVIVALSRTDTFNNTCANPDQRDTIVLYYTPTDIKDIETGKPSLVLSNPVNNILKGDVTKFVSGFSLSVTGIDGRRMLQDVALTEPNFTIDVSTLPASLYFLQLSDGRQRVVKKFVKE